MDNSLQVALIVLLWGIGGGLFLASSLLVFAIMFAISIIMRNIDKQREIRIIVSMGNTSEDPLTISIVMSQYLQMVERSRSKHTMLTYRNALHVFSELLEKNSLKPDITPIGNLTEDLFKKLSSLTLFGL